MPELPEVETIRRDLASVLIGRKVKDIQIRKRKIVRGHPRSLYRDVINQRIADISRRGKLLIFSLQPSNNFLLLHLKMTGQLIFHDAKDTVAGGHPWPPLDLNPTHPGLPNKYTHVIFALSGNAKLYFNDLRQFGYLQVVTLEQKEIVMHTYGIEPLTSAFTLANFRDAIRKRTTSLKSVLLNQAAVAGLGNIYVDEACFHARVRPTRRAHTLSHAEVKKLHHACQHIIAQAIKHRGTTFGNYRDSRGQRGNYVRYLKVYGRGGQACLRCRTGIIKKIKIAGRGTTYCPQCQK